MHGARTPISLISPFSHSSRRGFCFPSEHKSVYPASCRFFHGIEFRPSSLLREGGLRDTVGGRRRRRALLRASRRESPYDVLGVSPSATPAEIKRAYRKLALKFHPDVNKEVDAEEKFMRIKHAYNTVLNADSRSRSDFRKGASNYSSWTSEGKKSKDVQEEEFYGFGNFLRDVQITIEDFFRDLQTEFQNWEATASAQGKPKSLWEELADIGEEFVEFLEKELNIAESNFDGGSGDNPSESREDNQGKAGEESTIEDNIDEIEAALAQLKKELGL